MGRENNKTAWTLAFVEANPEASTKDLEAAYRKEFTDEFGSSASAYLSKAKQSLGISSPKGKRTEKAPAYRPKEIDWNGAYELLMKLKALGVDRDLLLELSCFYAISSSTLLEAWDSPLFQRLAELEGELAALKSKKKGS